LLDVWSQVLLHDCSIVKLGSEQFPVSTSKNKRLRQVEFKSHGKTIIGIEQNPNTKSNWAKMARSGIDKGDAVYRGRTLHRGGCGGKSHAVREANANMIAIIEAKVLQRRVGRKP